MADVKMTQKDYFNEIIALATEAGREDVADFARGRIEQLEKKASSKKSTKTQEANEKLKVVILDTLRGMGQASTVSEVMAANAELGALSNQKVSAVLRLMIEDGSVAKTVEGRKSLFAIKGE